MSIKSNIEFIQSNIEKSAALSGRNPNDIKLLSVTKTVPVDRISELYQLGYKAFGENRIQEYREKVSVLPEDCEWHIIGRLQKNKLKYILGNVELIHSLADFETANEAEKILDRKNLFQDFLIEVNISGEETKDGVPYNMLDEFIEKIDKLNRINIKGFMTIGALNVTPDFNRKIFATLKKEFDKYSSVKTDKFEMKYLSMGMSDDYSIAIEEGSNLVRIGSAIFGKRVY